VRDGTIQRHAYVGWFNIYFHTVLYMLYHLRIARIFIFGCGFLATVAKMSVLWLENSGPA
jgi:hypothetical protein